MRRRNAIHGVRPQRRTLGRHPIEAARQEVRRAGDRTRWGVAQAITWTAQRVNQNPDVRFEMERFAGEPPHRPCPNFERSFFVLPGST
jgi:hypothetical protein